MLLFTGIQVLIADGSAPVAKVKVCGYIPARLPEKSRNAKFGIAVIKFPMELIALPAGAVFILFAKFITVSFTLDAV